VAGELGSNREKRQRKNGMIKLYENETSKEETSQKIIIVREKKISRE